MAATRESQGREPIECLGAGAGRKRVGRSSQAPYTTGPVW